MENDLISRSALTACVVNTPSAVCQAAPYDHMWFTRLVDREQEILNMIENAPAVDAVAVVRCKECKYSDDIWTDGAGNECVMCGHPRFDYETHDSAFFCAYGERRADDGK